MKHSVMYYFCVRSDELTLTLHKLQEESGEKGPLMTTGFIILQPYVNFTISEFKFTLGWQRQRALMCRRQALFPHFLLAALIFFCICSVKKNTDAHPEMRATEFYD